LSIYRVVVSFLRDQLQFMAERGVWAMNPGEALNTALDHLMIKPYLVKSLKTIVEKPDELASFSYDAQNMICLGTRYTVQEIWQKRYGDIV
jgi:hypothetical protein